MGPCIKSGQDRDHCTTAASYGPMKCAESPSKRVSVFHREGSEPSVGCAGHGVLPQIIVCSSLWEGGDSQRPWQLEEFRGSLPRFPGSQGPCDSVTPRYQNLDVLKGAPEHDASPADLAQTGAAEDDYPYGRISQG